MTGRSSINGLIWADAELEGLAVDYDDVVISVTETATNTARHVRCRGYIGYQAIGFWDEVIVESAWLDPAHDFLSVCRQNLERRFPKGAPETGQHSRNKRAWTTLVIKLIDGAEMLVVASEFEVL